MTDPSPPQVPADGHVIACRTAFEAQAVLATLEAAGVEAVVLETTEAVPHEPAKSAPIYVVASDRERARIALEAAADIDWDAIDVGEREDDVPFTAPGRMPWPARIAFAIAIIVALLGVAGAVAMVAVELFSAA